MTGRWHCALLACDWCDRGRQVTCPRAGACQAVRPEDGDIPGMMCGRGKHEGINHKCKWVTDGVITTVYTWYQALEEKPMADQVNHPSHYTSHPSGVECIQIIRHMTFNVGAAMKYLWRNGLKDGNPQVQDLEKAIWHIKDEIRRLQHQQESADDEGDPFA